MTEEKLMLSGKLYSPYDPELKAMKLRAHRLSHRFSDLDEDMETERTAILKELFASIGEGSFIQGPLFAHYGIHTTIGRNFFGNYNLTISDDAQVTIGDDCNFGPNVTIATTLHPMIGIERRALVGRDGEKHYLCYTKPIRIGNDCWFGSNVTVCPGVTIGNGCVIGAGSVVTRSIPDNCFAAGNPCRVIREIDENDSIRLKPEIADSYV